MSAAASATPLERLARVTFFALLPAAAAAGALATPALLSLAGLASLRPSRMRTLQLGPAAWAIVLFLGWAVISAFWSMGPGFATAAKLTALAVLGLAFSHSCASRSAPLTLASAVAAMAVLAALLCFEAASDLALTRAAEPEEALPARIPGRGAVVLIALLWGCLGALLAWRRPLAAFASAAVGVSLCLQFEQSANTVAFAAGLLGFAAAWAWPRAATFAAAAGLAGWILIAPFATGPLTALLPRSELPHSYAARVEIWRYAIGRIDEAPLAGHGLDASRAVTDRIEVGGENMRAVPQHPHSASLQIWYELGATGALLAAAALSLCGWRLARTTRDNRIAAAASTGTLAALGVIANLSYSLWQEWWAATIVVAAAINAALRVATGRHRPAGASDRESRAHP